LLDWSTQREAKIGKKRNGENEWKISHQREWQRSTVEGTAEEVAKELEAVFHQLEMESPLMMQHPLGPLNLIDSLCNKPSLYPETPLLHRHLTHLQLPLIIDQSPRYKEQIITKNKMSLPHHLHMLPALVEVDIQASIIRVMRSMKEAAPKATLDSILSKNSNQHRHRNRWRHLRRLLIHLALNRHPNHIIIQSFEEPKVECLQTHSLSLLEREV
jgi:hypothetical protein